MTYDIKFSHVVAALQYSQVTHLIFMVASLKLANTTTVASLVIFTALNHH